MKEHSTSTSYKFPKGIKPRHRSPALACCAITSRSTRKHLLSAMSSSSSASALQRLVTALSPLALCLVSGWLVTAGLLGFGGGEKDVFVILPLALWSMVFAVASLAMWAGGASLSKATRVSALIALGVLAVSFALLVALA